MFSAVPNKKLKRFQLDCHPFDDKSFKKIFKVTPVKDLKKL
jgi:secreted Zn-dependent insulinase-like peptidase